MAFLRVTVSLVALTGLGAASMEAQMTRAHVLAAPQGRPRIASIAPPPPPPRTTHSYQTVFQNPIIVTPDGRVLIDLGNGYEQVASACPYAYGYGCQSYGYPTAPQTPVNDYGDDGNYGQPTYAPPSYAPPAYSAPMYAAPTYPSGGAQGNSGGCPPGYIPTGSYSTCIDPSRSSAGSAAMPSASGVQPRGRPSASRGPTAPRVIRR